MVKPIDVSASMIQTSSQFLELEESEDESASATAESVGDTWGGFEQIGLLQLPEWNHQARAG